MEMGCTRCGRVSHCEYGNDGLAYCGSCIFYGLNRPCFRCRMYLPITELQQCKGQWVCPYCLMDMRDEDRAVERGGTEQYPRDTQLTERCSRCGRHIDMAYYYKGMTLCGTCVEEEKREWGSGSDKPPLTPIKITVKKAATSALVRFLESLIGEVAHRIGIRARQNESAIIAKDKAELETEKESEEKEGGREKKPPPAMLSAAKPLAEAKIGNIEREVKQEKEPTQANATDDEEVVVQQLKVAEEEEGQHETIEFEESDIVSASNVLIKPEECEAAEKKKLLKYRSKPKLQKQTKRRNKNIVLHKH